MMMMMMMMMMQHSIRRNLHQQPEVTRTSLVNIFISFVAI